MDSYLKRSIITWCITLTLSTVLMVVFLIFRGSFLEYISLIYLIIIKFLSGFGLILSITSIGIFVLKTFSAKFKGNPNRMAIFLVIIILLPVVLLVYGGITIYRSNISEDYTTNLLNRIIFVYGIGTLMLSLYIIPLIKGNFADVTVVTTGDMIKNSIGDGVRGLKKRFFKIRKDLGKVQLQDQLKIKEYLEMWRQRLATVSLVLLGIGFFVFTPICVVFLIVWYRIYFLNARKLFKFEVVFLMIAMIISVIISVVFPFLPESVLFGQILSQSLLVQNIFYFIGLLLVSFLYFRKFFIMNFKDWRTNYKTRKIKDLKKREKDLKQNLEKKEKLLKESQKEK